MPQEDPEVHAELQSMRGEVADLRRAVARLEGDRRGGVATLRAVYGRARSRWERARDPLGARFDEVGPWFTEYVIDGRRYGGVNSYAGDERVPTFFEWAGTVPRILELGSFEGAHTFQLAAGDGVEEVVGLEGREANLRRARFVLDIFENPKVRFEQVDVGDPASRLEEFFPVDAVFCAGLLYHLPDPWVLLRRLSAGTPKLFLDTHHAAEADTEAGGYRGKWWQEGGLADPLSGLSPRSFWPTVDELVRMCADCGFSVARRHDVDDWKGHGPRVWLYLLRD